MKKNVGLLVAAGCMLASSASFAAEPNLNYVAVSGKYAMVSDMDLSDRLRVDSDDGYGIAASLGRHWEMLRFEVELSTQSNDINSFEIGGINTAALGDSGDVRINAVLVNAFVDVPVSNGFSVYGGGGFGQANAKVNVFDIDTDDTVTAYKFAAGVSYAFTPELGADLGYEYFATADVDLDNVELKDISSNNIVLALKYMF